jgi:hypothetical protein
MKGRGGEAKKDEGNSRSNMMNSSYEGNKRRGIGAIRCYEDWRVISRYWTVGGFNLKLFLEFQ